jgi:hypothetical protein
MPELPDIETYLHCLAPRLLGQKLHRIRLASPFFLRSVTPPPQAAEGRQPMGLRRLGKRIVIALEGDLYLVLHLMIAGRLQWRETGVGIPRHRGLAAFDFSSGTLMVTEAGSKKRASLHLGPHRSPPVQRYRQRLLRRDPASGSRARLSPFKLTRKLSAEEVDRLFHATSPHFSPSFYCGGASARVCCVALPRPPWASGRTDSSGRRGRVSPKR